MKTTFQYTILAALLSSLPFTAFSVDVSDYNEFITAISNGATELSFTNNIDVETDLMGISSGITLIGNGYSLNGNYMQGFTLKDHAAIKIDGFIDSNDPTCGIHDFQKEGNGPFIDARNYVTIEISNSNFYNNISVGQDENLDRNGAVIYAGSDADIRIINSTFSNNEAYSSGGVIKTYDGNTGNKGANIVIINSKFEGNTSYFSNSGTLDIHGVGDKFIIESSDFINNTNINEDQLTYENNFANNGGGAIVISDQALGSPNGKAIPTIFKCLFDGNSTSASGGAICFDGVQGIMTEYSIVDSSFVNNSAGIIGGAIVAANANTDPNANFNFNIYAHTNNVTFSGNETDVPHVMNGSDIYFLRGNLNLVAADGYKIQFDGSVAGDLPDYSFLNINKEAGSYSLSDNKTYVVQPGGEVQFNGGLAYLTAYMYQGKLTLAGKNEDSNGFIAVELNFVGSSILNSNNNALDYFGSLTGTIYEEDQFFTINIEKDVTVTYTFDVDIKSDQADLLCDAHNNGGTFLLSIDLLSEATKDNEEHKIPYSLNNVYGTFENGGNTYTIVTDKFQYTIIAINDDTEGSYLLITAKAKSNSTDSSDGFVRVGLAGAVYEKKDEYQNLEEGDHIVRWYPNIDVEPNDPRYNEPKNYLEKDIVVEGHNKGIVSDPKLGAPQEGMIVGEDFRATVNNARDWSGFRNGIINRGKLYINDSNFTSNTGEGGVLNEGGEVHLAGDVTFDNPDADYDLLSKGGSVSMHGGHARFNQGVHGENGATFDIAGDVDFNGTLSGFDRVTQTSGTVSAGRVMDTNYEIEGGRLNVRREEDFTPDGFTFGGGTVNAQNGRVGDIHFTHASGTPGSVTNVEVDIDLGGLTMDRLLPEGATWPGGTINVSKFNVLTDTTAKTAYVNFTNSYLKHYVTTDVKTVYGPIYNYNIGYDEERGDFFFTARGGKNWGDYNPAVIPSSVAALMGGYLAQLNSYDDAFRNMDMYMLQGGGTSGRVYKVDGNDKNGVVPRSPFAHANYWVRPFSSFENVPLRNGPNVSNVSYGSLIGNESRMYNLGSGWSGIIGGYMGYYGSHQIYGGASIYQDGGMVGMVSMAYKGNLFTGLTMNVGASDGNAKTMYGRDDFSMLSAGVASKTGYNYALSGGKYVIQPVAMVSYSMVNPFSYNNAAGLHMNADAIHAVHAEPGVKFIADLGNELQFYTSASFVFNFFDKTDFKANRVKLPEMSIKHYVKYGMGLRQTWDNGLIGYIQAYMTNGGRNSVSIQCGLRWDFGE